MLEGDLISAIDKLSEDLDAALEDQEKKGKTLAEADAQYNALLHSKALQEKDSGTPVTFITQFIKGDKDVAELRMKRDIAEVMYDAAKDRTVNLRAELKICNDQAQREWAAAGRSVNPVPATRLK